MELGIALRLPVFSDCLSVFFQAPKNQGLPSNGIFGIFSEHQNFSSRFIFYYIGVCGTSLGKLWKEKEFY